MGAQLSETFEAVAHLSNQFSVPTSSVFLIHLQIGREEKFFNFLICFYQLKFWPTIHIQYHLKKCNDYDDDDDGYENIMMMILTMMMIVTG